jgi:hypothetical protein
MTPAHFDDIRLKVASGDTVNGKKEDLGNACIEGIITPFRATHSHEDFPDFRNLLGSHEN